MQRGVASAVVACGLLVGAGAGGVRPAEAFESTAGNGGWDPNLTAIVITSFLVDLGFSAVSLQHGIRESPLPRAYGAAELILAIPQVVFFVPAVRATWRSGRREDAFFLGLAAWSAVLAGHGAWTLLHSPPAKLPVDQPSRSARQPRVPWAVSPAVLAAAGPQTRPAASLLLHGRF